MSVSQRGVPIAGLRPEAVTRMIDLLREQAEQLTAGEQSYHDDPLSYAWLTCLEAAASVGRAIAVTRRADACAAGTSAGGGPSAPDGAAPGSAPERAEAELQEAWAAARGAATSVRLSLFRRHGSP